MDDLRRLPNYIKAFGPISGPALAFRLGGGPGGASLPARSFRVPGESQRFWLRPSRSDHSIFWQCWVKRQYDFSHLPQSQTLLETARSSLNAGNVPVVIDAGANIGLATRWFCRQFPFASIIAIEPDEDNVRVLRQNVANFGDRVSVMQAGIASQPGWCMVTGEDRGSAGLQTERCEAGTPGNVPLVTVDDALATVPAAHAWIVKLDIEGAQRELFSSDTGWIDRTDLIILELDDWQFPWSGSAVPFFSALAGRPFDYLVHEELIYCFRHPG